MPQPWFQRLFAPCMVVCVTALFFFPLPYGPFQATHGPTTEFRAQRAILVLVSSIISATLFLSSLLVDTTPGSSTARVAIQNGPDELQSPPAAPAILRC
jgi:hypothetical protein